MKLLLIQPLGNLVNPGSFVRNCVIEPIGLEYVASLAKTELDDVLVKHPINNLDELLSIISEFQPDIVGFSVYTYAYNICLKWAQKIKSHFPHIINLFGGYHPSLKYDEIIYEDAIDFVIRGEGEKSISYFLKWIKGEKIKTPGLIYVNDSKELIINEPQRIKNLEFLPRPLRDDNFIKQSKSFQIMYPPPSEQKSLAQVDFSRGCIHNCDFCCSKLLWGKEVTWHNNERVINEIESLYEKYQTNLIYFCDPNITNSRKKLIDLCNALINADLPVYWWCYCRVDELDKELLLKMKAAKAVKITVGIEVSGERKIKEYKKTNINWNYFIDIFNYAHEIGLIVRGTFMMDFPGANSQYYSNFKDFLINLPVDDIRISFCTPFPKTQMSKYCDNNIEVFDDYTTDVPVLNCEGYRSEELIKLRKDLVNIFYSSDNYLKLIINKTKLYKQLAASYLEYFDFAYEHNVLYKETYNRIIKTLNKSTEFFVNKKIFTE